LPWRTVFGLGYLAAVGWTLSLALVDGRGVGVAGRLEVPTEYLTEVAGVVNVAQTVRGFADRIPVGSSGHWTTHVAAHPPEARLVFVGLARVGLGSGAAAGLVCIAGRRGGWDRGGRSAARARRGAARPG
jgi:hypothetical protein